MADNINQEIDFILREAGFDEIDKADPQLRNLAKTAVKHYSEIVRDLEMQRDSAILNLNQSRADNIRNKAVIDEYRSLVKSTMTEM